jgi:hypothetical protein
MPLQKKMPAMTNPIRVIGLGIIDHNSRNNGPNESTKTILECQKQAKLTGG